MRVFAQVVGVATGDSAPAVLVVTDGARYLFNVGEGLQRFCMEHKVRLVKVDGLFFTRPTTETMGGLPGMLLTLADMGKRVLGVHGPTGLADYLYGLRHFMRRDDVTVAAVEAGGEPDDDALAPLLLPDLTVHGVRLRAAQAVPAAITAVEALLAGQYTGAAVAHALAGVTAVDDNGLEIAAAAFNPLRVTRWPLLSNPGPRPPPPPAAAAVGGKPAARPGVVTPPATLPGAMDPSRWVEEGLGSAAMYEYAMCYVLETAALPGKFYPDRAARYGIKPGPVFGRLTRGESVEVTVPRALAVELGFSVPPAPPAAASPLPPAAAESPAAAAAAGGAGAEAASSGAAAGSSGGGGGGKGGKKKGGGKDAASAVIVDGVTITVSPDMVKDADQPGQLFAIVDVPTPAFMPTFLASPRLTALAAQEPAGDGGAAPLPRATVVFHFSPPAVVNLPAYQAWMRGCGDATTHVLCHSAATPAAAAPPPPPVAALPPGAPSPLAALGPLTWSLSPQLPPLLFRAQALQLCKMHILDPAAFPLPHPLDVGTARAAAALRIPVPPGGSALVELMRAHLAMGAAGEAAVAGAMAAAAAATAAALAPATAAPTAPADLAAAAAATAAHRDVIMRDYAMRVRLPGVPAAPCVHAVPLLSHFVVPLARAREGVDVADVPAALTAWEPLATMLADTEMAPFVREAMARNGAAAGGDGGDGGGGSGVDRVPAAAEVVFTGTSSAVPSKYRNVSGMFVRLDDRGNAVVLDGGEGTYGQLARRYGEEGAGDRLCRLHVIWISHMHADHHLGIMRLIKERAGALARGGRRAPPVLVVGPTRLYLWLLEASRLDASLLGAWRFVDAEHFVQVPAASLTAGPVRGPERLDVSTRVATRVAASALATGVARSSPSAAPPPAGPAGPAVAAAAAPPAPSPAARPLHASPSAGAAAGASDGGGSSKRARVESPSAGAVAVRVAGGIVDSPVTPSPLAVVAPRRSPAAVAAAATVGGAAALVGGSLGALPPAGIDRCEPFGAEAGRHVIPLPPHAGSHAADGDDDSAGDHLARPAFIVAAFRAAGILALRAVRVQHCFKAYGLQLVLNAGGGRTAPWSLVYSGDTRPCVELVQLATHAVMPSPAAIAANEVLAAAGAAPPAALLTAVQAAHGADVVIHEATFEDSAEGRLNARYKKHSTAGEACAVADAVACSRLLLTHFSARYPKLPVLPSAEAGAGAASPSGTPRAPRAVCIAYDLMSVHVRRVASLGALIPALRVLFAEEAENDDDGVPDGAGTGGGGGAEE